MMQILKSLIFLIYPFIVLSPTYAQQGDWETYYEKSDYKATPGYNETIEYAKALAQYSDFITYTSFGESPQRRELPLLIADKSSESDFNVIRKNGKAVLLIQACIHAGESDGKDAGLMLLRDMAIHKQNLELLESVTILFVPIFNVDGHENFSQYNRINQNGPEEMGWRATAQRLNLNRDYLKADAPEMQAMIQLYQTWLPDFYIDCHVTDGADYVYPLTYGLQMQGNLNHEQSSWIRDIYLPFVKKEMQDKSQPIAPYMDFVQWHDPKAGIRTYYESPRYSGGYAAINNRPALLIETHMLKNYKTRVSATYNMLLASLQLIADHSGELIQINDNADNIASKLFTASTPFALTYKNSGITSKFQYQGYEYIIEKSDLTGGNWYKYSDKPASFEIDQYDWEPDVKIELPLAYIIPPEWDFVVEKLKLHHVDYEILNVDTLLEVDTYQFENVKWKTRPFEGRLMIDYKVKPILKKILFPKGSAVVNLNQRSAQVAVHLLEPEGPDALVRWGFFNTIFEQKEYAESYVMEKMAREMLENHPELKSEFEAKLAKEEEFASSSYGKLNWFYSKSPYWDEGLNLYPIGRIMKK